MVGEDLTISPGASLYVPVTDSSDTPTTALTISGDLTLTQGSTIEIGVARGTSTSHSPINVSSCVSFDGRLSLIFKEPPQLNTPIPVVSYSCHFGVFSQIEIEVEDSPCSYLATPQYASSSLMLTFNIHDCNDELDAAHLTIPSLVLLIVLVKVLFLYWAYNDYSPVSVVSRHMFSDVI